MASQQFDEDEGGDPQFQAHLSGFGDALDALDFDGSGGGRKNTNGYRAPLGRGFTRERSLDRLAEALSVDKLINTGKARVKGTFLKVTRLTEQRRLKVARRMRQIITGDANTRISDHLRDRLSEPVHVKLIDKLSFTGGILFLLLIQYIVLVMPRKFGTFYVWCIVPLTALRLYLYKKQKFEYFLIDYCYFVNLVATFQVLLWPDHVLSSELVFAAANGPLTVAILAWRNSLVFHSLDKTTSLIIHFFPSLLTYCVRWYHVPEGGPLCMRPDCTMGWRGWFGYPLAMYLVWQLLYIIFTEVVHRQRLEADPGLHTSVRWFTSHPSPLLSGALVVCRKLGFVRTDEKFDGNTLKTKIVFVVSQFLYTIVTLIPVKFQYESQTVHAGFIMFVFCMSAWNGAGYYFEVFAKRYRAKFEEAMREHQMKRRRRSSSVSSANSASTGGGSGAENAHPSAATVEGDGGAGAGAVGSGDGKAKQHGGVDHAAAAELAQLLGEGGVEFAVQSASAGAQQGTSTLPSTLPVDRGVVNDPPSGGGGGNSTNSGLRQRHTSS